MSNALRVAAINSIGDFVLFLGKVSTVAIVVVIGHELLRVTEYLCKKQQKFVNFFLFLFLMAADILRIKVCIFLISP